MPKKINTRGHSCPEPVIMTKKALNELSTDEQLVVIVDKEVARENVSRFARNSGYNVEESKVEDGYKLKINK